MFEDDAGAAAASAKSHHRLVRDGLGGTGAAETREVLRESLFQEPTYEDAFEQQKRVDAAKETKRQKEASQVFLRECDRKRSVIVIEKLK